MSFNCYNRVTRTLCFQVSDFLGHFKAAQALLDRSAESNPVGFPILYAVLNEVSRVVSRVEELEREIRDHRLNSTITYESLNRRVYYHVCGLPEVVQSLEDFSATLLTGLELDFFPDVDEVNNANLWAADVFADCLGSIVRDSYTARHNISKLSFVSTSDIPHDRELRGFVSFPAHAAEERKTADAFSAARDAARAAEERKTADVFEAARAAVVENNTGIVFHYRRAVEEEDIAIARAAHVLAQEAENLEMSTAAEEDEGLAAVAPAEEDEDVVAVAAEVTLPEVIHIDDDAEEAPVEEAAAPLEAALDDVLPALEDDDDDTESDMGSTTVRVWGAPAA